MEKQIFELMAASALMGGHLPNVKIPSRKYYKKPLKEYRIAPRSMTPEGKKHYDKHKNLNGFYS